MQPSRRRSSSGSTNPHRSSPLPSLLPLLPLLLVALVCCSWCPLSVRGQWFSDPCQYNPRALQLLRQRFQSVVGQQYATEAIYAHVQHHLEQYERSRVRWEPEEDQMVAPNKPLVLSFHGPTGTGKSLTANSISSALFYKAQSSHVHTYHGSDFSGTTAAQVADSIAYLKREFSAHVRRCPLALFIIEEIHLMAPGVLDALRHLMDAQAPNTRVKVEAANAQGETTGGGGGGGGDGGSSRTTGKGGQGGAGDASDGRSRSDLDPDDDASELRGTPHRPRRPAQSHSVAINFSHVIWLFTTNIGSQQVQKVAYDAAKQGKPRESLSPKLLQEMLVASLAHSEQLQLLRDSSVLSALVPFFPLFKMHVKECAQVQLEFRRKFWLHQRQLANFSWDPSVLSYAAAQLKYQGPISIYGCKNIHEILTHVLLSHLTRTFVRVEEEQQQATEEMMKDRRVGTTAKFLSYGANLLRQARQMFTGPTWNYANANVSVSIQQQQGGGAGAGSGSGAEDIVFVIERPAPVPAARLPNGKRDPSVARTVRTEIRKSLHAYAHSAAFHSVPETHKPSTHAHMTEEGDETAAGAAHGRLKEEL